jgi:predicted amidophosphoribosyltransferase
MISLKGGRLESAFQFYAKAFVTRRSLFDLPSNAVLVACPGRQGRRHSEIWALSLSKLLGLPLIEALELEEDSGSQKGKSRYERQRIRFRKKNVLRHKYVIFIDDIVTTGATAVAAQKALGATEGFEVWCLAHRRQLAADLVI